MYIKDGIKHESNKKLMKMLFYCMVQCLNLAAC